MPESYEPPRLTFVGHIQPQPQEGTMQDPSIGRIVHFVAPLAEGADTYAAIVTKVHSHDVVDLVTFGSRSVYFHESVARDTVAAPGERCWSWPPRVA